MKYFVVTGEPSGDALGAKLLSALRARDPESEFEGVGGEAMARQGFRSLFPLADISVMGILPVLARLPTLLRRINETARAVVAASPDVLVLIDSPDFTHRVAKKARKTLPDLKVVDYVSPTVWAWRPGRAKKMRKCIDLVLALLPFEPDAHKRLGGPDCLYVGHPLIERLAELRGDESGREDGPVLVLPGSRRSVLARMGPVFSDALARLHALRPGQKFVLPVAGPIEALVRAQVEKWPVKPRIISGEAEKYAAFRTARAALAASGTVTLELALSGTPTVVAYKVPKLEEFIGRRLIQVPTIVLPNLILGENAFPEFLQDEANGETLARAVAA
jgi:lipid-A-disaccharide synthase